MSERVNFLRRQHHLSSMTQWRAPSPSTGLRIAAAVDECGAETDSANVELD